jgi:hypothetical protein
MSRTWFGLVVACRQIETPTAALADSHHRDPLKAECGHVVVKPLAPGSLFNNSHATERHHPERT